MGNVLIYVPGGCQRDRSGLREIGLDAYDDDGVTLHATDAISETPDGGMGVLFYWTARGARNLVASIPQTSLTTQTWRPCVADGELPAGRAWVGWTTDEPPRANDLARAKQQGGDLLALDDVTHGEEWLIPVARQLPRKVTFDDAGEVNGSIVSEKFSEFWDATWKAAEMFTPTDGGFEADYKEALNYCALALGINYRIGRDLVAGLGLLTTEHFFAIPRIAAEFDIWPDLFNKKKVPEGTPSSCSGNST